MLAAQAQRGGDGIGTWTDGRGVALGECHAAVTNEGALERQPHVDDAGTLRVVFDGRIDNREELQSMLAAAGRQPRDVTDVELVLHSYAHWGAGCAGYLLGDFAFVIWDARTRSIVAARDVLGLRPLYFFTSDRLIAIASELAPLLRHPRLAARPNEGFLAECLAGQIRHRSDTVWRDVVRLQPAHVLVWKDGRTTIRPYWQPERTSTLRHKTDNDYGEHLADLLCRSTRARLRCAGRFGLMLSGGLDSSSVLGAVQQVTRECGDPVRTYSLCSPGEGWDESEYLDHATSRWAVSSRRLSPHPADLSYFSSQVTRFADLPNYPTAAMARSLFAAAAADGARVLLTGIWSDEWFTGSGLYYADLLKRMRLRRLWHHHRAQSGDPDAFRPLSLFRSAAWPLVPWGAREAIKRALGRDGVPTWIDRSFARRVDLTSRIRAPRPDVPLRTLAKTDTFANASSGGCLHTTEYEQRGASELGIETRHPFADRRILEFALAIPDEQRWRGRHTKFVVRTAARDWVPQPVLQRVAFPSAASVVFAAIRGLFETSSPCDFVVARRGWVDAPALGREYRVMADRYAAGDHNYEQMTSPLWLVSAVELWAREHAGAS